MELQPFFLVALGGAVSLATQLITSRTSARALATGENERNRRAIGERDRDAITGLMTSVAMLADILNGVGQAAEQMNNLGFAEHLSDASRNVSLMHRLAYPVIYSVAADGLVTSANSTYEAVGSAFHNWAESIVNEVAYDEGEVERARTAVSRFMETARAELLREVN